MLLLLCVRARLSGWVSEWVGGGGGRGRGGDELQSVAFTTFLYVRNEGVVIQLVAQKRSAIQLVAPKKSAAVKAKLWKQRTSPAIWLQIFVRKRDTRGKVR
jgi:hypothetical protein